MLSERDQLIIDPFLLFFHEAKELQSSIVGK